MFITVTQRDRVLDIDTDKNFLLKDYLFISLESVSTSKCAQLKSTQRGKENCMR